MRHELHDDDPEHARVSAAQQFLFRESPRAVCAEIDLNSWAALKLHEEGWLSFNPETTPQLDGAKDAELRFVGSFVGAGCDSGFLHQLLDSLSKPYSYRGSRIYFDWSTKHWRLLPEPRPEPDPEAVFSDWIDSLSAEGDAAQLAELKDQIEAAILSVRLKE